MANPAVATPLKRPSAPARQRTAADDKGPSPEFALMARSSSVVAAWVLVSRITGFVRVAVIAAVLGPTYFGNLFQFSNAVPVLIYASLSGSLISAMLVPPLVRCLDSQDQEGARRLANGFFGTILAIFFAVAVIGILVTPLVLQVMTGAVQDPEIRREQLRLGWPLMAMMLPQLLFHAISGVSVAVQQANGRFALAAAAPAVDNLGTVAVVGASALLYGTGTEIRDVSNGQILVLSLGTTIAAGLYAAVQWWGACRAGLRLVPSAGWKCPAIRRMFRMGSASVGYTCLSSAAFFGMLVIASNVPGGVAAYQIAHSFVQLPIALTAGPLAAVQLPQLSRFFDEGSLRGFATTYRSALRLVLFALLPTGLLLVTISHALAQAAAFGKMAAPAGVSLIAACLAGRGLGVLGEAVIMVGTSASYARRDAVSPLRAMALQVAICVIGMALARTTSDPRTLIWALGATAAAASSLAALYLHCRQTRALPLGVGRDVRDGVANVFAAAAAMGPAWLVVHFAADVSGGPWEGMQVVGAATLAAAATYLALQFARGSEELALLPMLPLPASLRQSLRQRREARATAPRRMPVDTRP